MRKLVGRSRRQTANTGNSPSLLHRLARAHIQEFRRFKAEEQGWARPRASTAATRDA